MCSFVFGFASYIVLLCIMSMHTLRGACHNARIARPPGPVKRARYSPSVAPHAQPHQTAYTLRYPLGDTDAQVINRTLARSFGAR